MENKTVNAEGKAYETDHEYDLWWALCSEKAGIHALESALHAGSAKRLLLMSAEELAGRRGIGRQAAEYIIYRRDHWDYGRAEEMLLQKQIRFLPFYDPDYPRRLLKTPGHPFALFVTGELPGEAEPAVALIGARECSEYGRLAAD